MRPKASIESRATFRRRGSAQCLLAILLAASITGAQEPAKLPAPPDFSQRDIADAVRELSDAWDGWISTTGDLEHRVLHLPMSEARYAIQRALGRYLDFLDKRHAYSDAVFAYIEQRRTRPAARMPVVAEEDVFEEQARLIGVNVLLLHHKLSSLKDAAEWTAVYSAADAEASQALKLQSARQAEVPVPMSTSALRQPEAMASLAYSKSDREVQDALGRLWTTYYQALVDAIEQRPSGSVALTPLRGHGGADPGQVPTLGQPAPEAWRTFVGAWSYTAGSQQFNGVAEPASVLLEVWFDSGTLVGRYRAELPDFQGMQRVDLRLEGIPARNSRQLSMHFESKDPPASGQVILEPAGPSGLDIMLVRAVTAPNRVPRGRELLVRQ